MTTVFDRPDAESRFLDFVRKEFHEGRATPLRKAMADKTRVAGLLESRGVPCPRKIWIGTGIADLAGLDLPQTFVLKIAHGWSARGVMLLSQLGGGRFFCFLSQRILTWEEIAAQQDRIAAAGPFRRGWIVEEMVSSTIAGKPIPLDYKFYCFRDRIAMIAQIDRNVSPPAVCLMDGEYRPLRHRIDYVLASPRVRTGIPVVPLHAARLRRLAAFLSRMTDSPFVSIDLYDSPQGPVFGEFTFSPGGTHKRMWVFGTEFLDRLEAGFQAAEARLAAGDADPGGVFEGGADGPLPPPEVHAILANAVLGGSTRAAVRLAEMAGAESGATDPAGGDAPDIAAAWHEIAETIRKRTAYEFAERRRFLRRRGWPSGQTGERADDGAGK